MKVNKIELNVDVIGGQGPLTIAEEKALSIFFKERKLASIKSSVTKKNRTVHLTKAKG